MTDNFKRTLQATCSDAEWAARVDLAACYRLADIYGMSKVIWNHITARIADEPDAILVLPLGLMYHEVCASNLIKLKLDGRVIGAEDRSLADTVNETAYTIHGPMFRSRPDIMAIMHTHTIAGQAVSALKCGLLPTTQEALLAYGDTGYHAYEGISNEVSESERLAQDLGSFNQLILRNHGLLTVGKTIAECFWRMYQLDRACSVQMSVLASGEAWERPDEALCRHARMQHNDWHPGHHEWPAWLRMLNQRQPDYKT